RSFPYPVLTAGRGSGAAFFRDKRPERAVTGNRLSPIFRKKAAYDARQVFGFIARNANIIGRPGMVYIGSTDEGQVTVFAPGNQKNDPAFFIEVRDGLRTGLNFWKDQMRSPDQPERTGR